MEFRKEKNQKLIFFNRLSFLCRPSLGDLKVGNWGSVICSFQSAGMVAFYLSLVYFTSKYLKIKKPVQLQYNLVRDCRSVNITFLCDCSHIT